jgi:hypothetical protein
MDIGIVHDGYGCYLAEFFPATSSALFFVPYNWLGFVIVQQIGLEGMAEKKIIFQYTDRYG